jgi:biopolymer transport protein ExbD
MEINLPPDKSVLVETSELNLMMIRVNDKGTIYWNMGMEPPQKIEFNALRAFLLEKASSNSKLTVLLKIDRQGKYNTMVNLIDELNLARISRFSIAPLNDTDKAVLAKAQA